MAQITHRLHTGYTQVTKQNKARALENLHTLQLYLKEFCILRGSTPKLPYNLCVTCMKVLVKTHKNID